MYTQLYFYVYELKKKNTIVYIQANDSEIMVHFFQEFNDEHKPASEFREIINLE